MVTQPIAQVRYSMAPDEQDDHQYDEQETAPDVEPTLAAQNLHVVISRIKDSQGDYITKVWFNRKVRRFYVMGLLQEALATLMSSATEICWIGDDEDEADDADDDEDAYNPAFVPK